MRFGQLEDEIKKCEQHLDSTATRNTEAEIFLVRYLLVRICAEYEDRIKTLVQRRCSSRISDGPTKSFSSWAAEFATQRFEIGDIKGMLGRFGDEYKQTFHDSVNETPCHVAWDTLTVDCFTIC